MSIFDKKEEPKAVGMDAVTHLVQSLKLRNEKLTELEKNEAKEKEEIYRRLAETITKDVPVKEIGNLILWLHQYQMSFEQEISYHEEFDTFPQDGAVSFMKALQDKFGFTSHVNGGYGFFGPKPPEFMTVATGPGTTAQIPWGGFELPGYAGLTMVIGTHPTKDSFHFCISGTVKKKDHDVVKDIIERVRANLRNHSIYKGKAISLRFDEDFDPNSFEPGDVAPEFLDLSRINPHELVLSETLMRTVQDNLFTPVEKTELCRKFGVPLRRGALLSGTYGIGKTLTAHILAQKATANGWTYIYLKDAEDLAEGLRVARQYAPAVVFAEDIDSVMEGEDRDQEMNEILNTIDGIEIKGKEIMVVLTTNYVEDITPAMLRPGRIDVLIEMTAPDAKAAEKLLTVYGKGLIDPKSDLTSVGKLLAGQRPAMIAETVQRSKLSAITRMAINETVLKVEASDLEAAAHAMKNHVALVDGPSEETKSEAEMLGETLVSAVRAANQANGHTVIPMPVQGKATPPPSAS